MQEYGLGIAKGKIMILSVSRRTDIPAFYFEWFLNRMREGYLYVRNPMNLKQVSRVELSPGAIDCIVFWTKNPAPAMERLSELAAYTYYFQYTLNPYGKDIEPNLPDLQSRLKSFESLSEMIGQERIVWRYDPIFMNDHITVEWHKEQFRKLAHALNGMTDTVVISVLDDYKKIRNQMRTVNNRAMVDDELKGIMEFFRDTATNNGMKIRSCAEDMDLSRYGIPPGKCIDDERIGKLLNCDMDSKKDKNQRDVCGCIESVEVGVYNTCRHGCRYCYANYSSDVVAENCLKHDPQSPFLIGQMQYDDKVTVRKVKSQCRHGGSNLSFFD